MSTLALLSAAGPRCLEPVHCIVSPYVHHVPQTDAAARLSALLERNDELCAGGKRVALIRMRAATQLGAGGSKFKPCNPNSQSPARAGCCMLDGLG